MSAEKYSQDIAKSLGYRATWFPAAPVSVGTVCRFPRGVYNYVSSLEQMGIKIAAPVNGTAVQDIKHISSDGTSVQLKAAGETADLTPHIPKANIGIGINFSNEGSTVFLAAGMREHAVDTLELRHHVMGLLKTERWDKDWAVVGSVVAADVATVLVSTSKGGSVEFDFGVDAEVLGVEALNSAASAAVSYQDSMSTLIRAQNGLVPLFRAWRVKRRFLIGPHKFDPLLADEIDRAMTDADLEPDDDPLEEVTLASL